MISRIKGKIIKSKIDALNIENNGLCYEVFVPAAVMKALEKESRLDGQVELITYHYYQMEPSRGVPVLIGFQNEVEKEFFEKFISVSGVGPKAACRALAEPFSLIAGAIDSGNVSFLKSLPGIGETRARQIVAKLQGKVGKYGLIRDELMGDVKVDDDIRGEALEVLLQLQYKRGEAEEMLNKALERVSNIKTSEELLNEVYKERIQK